MPEYFKQFFMKEYGGTKWFARRVKEPSSWSAVAILLIEGEILFQTYPLFWLTGAAGCAVVAFVLKEKNVN